MWARVGLLLSLIVALSLVAVSESQGIVGCYYGTWASYRTGFGNYNTTHIDPFACSIMYYTFFGISPAGEITVLDPYNDLEENYGKGTIKKVNDLKKMNPDLKTFASVGGWNAGTKDFSIVANDAVLRQKFAASVVKFLISHNFNGVEINWFYPNKRHDLPYDDRTNFNLLLKALKEALTPYGFKLHIAVGGAESFAEESYDFAGMAQEVDGINLKSYDFHIGSELFVDFNAPLYPSKRDTTVQARQLSVDSALKFWTSMVPVEKLCLGSPFFGHNFELADSTNTAPGAPSKGPGPAGPFSQEKGTISYNELCLQWKTESWTKEFDEEQKVPYAHNNDVWVSYENAKSMFLKGQLALKYKLNCVNLWSLENDDFHGFCGEGKSPLLYALKRGINTPLRKITAVPLKKEQSIFEKIKSKAKQLFNKFKSWF